MDNELLGVSDKLGRKGITGDVEMFITDATVGIGEDKLCDLSRSK